MPDCLHEINEEIRGPASRLKLAFPEACIDFIPSADAVQVLLRPVFCDRTKDGPSVFSKANAWGYVARAWCKLAQHAATQAVEAQTRAAKEREEEVK